MSATGRPRGAPPGRRVARSVARCVMSMAVLLALYALLPLDAAPPGVLAVLLALGLAVFAWLVVRQLTAVERAPHPGLRAAEALATAIPLFLLLFAATYVRISAGYPGAFSEPLDRVDALYFAVTVFTTTGFGDVAATAPGPRIIVTIQMVADLLVLGLVVHAVVGTAQRATAGRSGSGTDSPDGTAGTDGVSPS